MITRWVDPLHETGATTLEPMTRHSESRENSLVFSMCKLMRQIFPINSDKNFQEQEIPAIKALSSSLINIFFENILVNSINWIQKISYPAPNVEACWGGKSTEPLCRENTSFFGGSPQTHIILISSHISHFFK